LVQEAYRRRGFKPTREQKWFRFEEGRFMACPLAVLMVHCYPRLPWKRWDDMKAEERAMDLAVENLGRDIVNGFGNGMEGVGPDYDCTALEYKRGFDLGLGVYCEIMLKQANYFALISHA
jgi:hypothetical protein